jgi:hypothetical protein
MALALTSPARAQEQSIGTVLGMPASYLASFVRVNTLPPPGRDTNRVTLLHLSPLVDGTFNSQIATVGVTKEIGGGPTGTLYFPADQNEAIPSFIGLINAGDAFSYHQRLTDGDAILIQVSVAQVDTGSLIPQQTRFLMVPADKVSQIIGTNGTRVKGPVHLQHMFIGPNTLVVALLAIEASGPGNLQIPGEDLLKTVLSLNSNVTVDTSQGSGSSAVTTVTVGQGETQTRLPR